jgi:SAM-dependent methyltransferase
MDASYFNSRFTPDPGRRRVWQAICEYLQPWVPGKARVLDIGAGYCDFINQIHAATKIAADRNPDVAGHCGPDVRFLEMPSIQALDLPASSVDVVFASNFLEHLSEPDLAALFDRLASILAPGGRLILIQPNYYYSVREYWDDFTHLKAFSHTSLGDFLRSRGYDILRMEKRFIPFSFKTVLPKSYFLTRLYLSLPVRPLAKQMLFVAARRR